MTGFQVLYTLGGWRLSSAIYYSRKYATDFLAHVNSLESCSETLLVRADDRQGHKAMSVAVRPTRGRRVF